MFTKTASQRAEGCAEVRGDMAIKITCALSPHPIRKLDENG